MQSLGRANPLRRDPAPSRWAYRMQRLWLTPIFRVTMRVGLPAFVVTLAIGIYLSDRADLPLIAGDGADKAVAEATALLRSTGPLAPRIRGLVRISDRRWNIVLDRDQTILLPATDPIDALDSLLALNKAEDIFARDITAIDLRNEHRPVLRLAPFALEDLRRAQGNAPKTESKT